MSRGAVEGDPMRAAGDGIGAHIERFRCFLSIPRSQLPPTTPLLHDVCRLWGIDPFIVTCALGFEPGRPWVSGRGLAPVKNRKGGPRTVVRGPDGSRMTVGVRADGFEARLRVRDGLLVGRGNELRLWLATPVPEAVRAAIVGREMAEVFDHDALRTRRYEITRAVTPGSFTFILAVTDVDAPG